MRKQELLKRIEKLEEEVERLEWELAEHKAIGNPKPLLPYALRRWPWPMWGEPYQPTWIDSGTFSIDTDIFTGYPAGTQGSITTVQ